MSAADPFPTNLPEPKSYYRGADVAQRIRSKNAVVFLRSSRSSLQQRNFTNRVHHRHVLILVLETAGKISLDGELHPLEPGNALLVLPYQFHHYIDLENDNLRWLFVTFELDEETDGISSMNHQVLQPAIADHALWQRIVQLWKALPDPLRAAELLAVLDQLLTRLCDCAQAARTRPGTLSTGGSWIAGIETLISESVMQGTTLAEVARKAGLSERHLRTRFEMEMGVSIRRYKANYQLHKAAALMQRPGLAISRIAELSGFHSQAVFTRFVRRETGLTPSEWRRSLQP